VGAGGCLHIPHRQVGSQRPLQKADAPLQVIADPVNEDAEPLGDPAPLDERRIGPFERREGRAQVSHGLVPRVHGSRRVAGPDRQADDLGLVG
jgi:hypothetical protein